MLRFFYFILFFLVTTVVIGQNDLSSLQSQLKNSSSDTGRIRLYLSISRYFENKRSDSAMHYAIKGLKLATHLHNKPAQGMFLYQLGVINILYSKLSTAHQDLVLALDIFTKLKDRKNMTLTYAELGIAESRGGNVAKAAAYLRKALDLSISAKDTVDMIHSYLKLGSVEEMNNNPAKALGYYKQAEALNKELPVGKVNPAILEHIGRVHLNEGDHANAIEHFKKGIEQSSHPEGVSNHITYLTRTGDAFSQQGNDDSALAYHKTALDKAEEFSMPEEQVMALLKIADIVKKSDADKSLGHLSYALGIARTMSHQRLQAEVYKAMAAIYRQEKRYNEALHALEQQHALLDSLFIINKEQELSGMHARNLLITSTARLEREEHELMLWFGASGLILLALLGVTFMVWRNARATKAMNARLAESNLVKDRLFSIIGHDLRGPIGNMTQLLTIMELDELDPAERKEIVGIMKQQCDASYEVLTSLLNWGKIQLQGAAVSMIKFEPEAIVSKNINVLMNQARAKALNLSNHVPAGLQVYADASQFDFIIRNLLSNAIKFSHKEGSIEVNAASDVDEDFVVFSVNDNGVGISAEQQQQFLRSNINVAYGTDGEKGTGLGLLLIKEFVQANGGKIWLESEEGKGSTFYFTLKKA
ncbi:ATP-binding protein [Emticicia sp. 21SJ11W-3]|uniref:ATP-binding protein n=1 Tax=Emticicia sp. 21SJ11W-3 TaxID=2916755 RepID=UPI00209DDE3C|nr:ATP-binding protein [Emticicia sp. 21SJ11W-3]UTA66572.1 ATP-binding protein [Emticicia sp. 21SJ11W-3]